MASTETVPHLDPTKPRRQRVEVDSPALLKALAEASAVFIAFTFVGGWSYLASYYSAFGVNPLELEVPIPVVCTTAIYVWFNARWPLVIAFVLIIGWGILSERFPRLSRSVDAAILVLLLLTVSTAGVVHGRQRAFEDASMTSSALPFVALALKFPKNDQPPCVDYQTYGSLDCKLLLHSNKTYYFFQPIPETGDSMGEASLNVFTVSDADVVGAHILRGLHGKVGIE